MRRFVLPLLATLLCWPAAAFATKAHRLFEIERSVNGNRVAYDWRPGSEPIRAYWLLEEGGTEELSGLEWQFAYGVSVEWSGDDGARFTLRPVAHRAIDVQRTPEGPAAVLEIDGRKCRLDRIWVEIGGGLLPGVEFVLLQGRSVDDGAACEERIVP
jgi:hypothetical protein